MKPRALVVEDDSEVVEQIEDSLCSIRHDFHWVVTQQDARKALESEDFDYVLLDLEIPAKSPKGRPSKEFGANVLADIRRIKGARRLPVIVMSGHVGHCLNHSIRFREQGASQFIAKPFPTEGRTLASVIGEVLSQHQRELAHEKHSKSNRKKSLFTGGEMVFFEDHVKLLGVEIISDRGTGQAMRVMGQLRRTDIQGNFVRLSADDIAQAIDALGGVGTITGCIRVLRCNITSRLDKQLRVKVKSDDVIAHDEQGYYLRDWITVVEGDGAPTEPLCPEDLNERQLWVLAELRRGTLVDRAMLEERFGIAGKTAKRDLAILSRRKLIRYARDGRGGFYRLE